MQDRVSTYPGRVKLTPVTGQTNTYDLERADSPTVAGTPLNKQTFLTDAAASAIAALGVSAPSLPSEALASIAAILSDMGVSNVAHIDFGSYVGTGTNSTTNYLDIVFPITPRIVFIAQAGYPMVGPGQTQYGLVWMYDQTSTVIANGNGIQWVLNGKTLRRRVDRDTITAAQLMNTSGTTYYYVGVGE